MLMMIIFAIGWLWGVAMFVAVVFVVALIVSGIQFTVGRATGKPVKSYAIKKCLARFGRIITISLIVGVLLMFPLGLLYQHLTHSEGFNVSAEVARKGCMMHLIPPMAKKVTYETDCQNGKAQFEVGEEDFRKNAESLAANDIQACSCTAEQFNNQTRQWENIDVKDGLKIESRAKNGGGFTLIFDRDTGKGYYWHAAN